MRQNWQNEVIAIAQEAGHAIMEVYNSEFSVSRKDDNSPLTQADLLAHHIIKTGLARITPDLPVLSEESNTQTFVERSNWPMYWLVDPLDGTREFIKRNGEFTVNIALIEQHVPVLGVVYAPAVKLLYYAARGEGAWRKKDGELPKKISARTCNQAQLTIVGSRSHAGERLIAFLSRLGPHELISMGSSLKICLVAEGGADIYPRLGPTSEWDTAAAQCVLVEAGGRLTDTKNRHLRYNTKESLLNPEFFASGAFNQDWAQYLP